MLATPLMLAGCGTVGIRNVYTALEAEGLRKRDTFATNQKEIACVADLSAGIDGVTIEIKMEKNVGPGTYDPPSVAGEFVTRKGTTQQKIALVWQAAEVDGAPQDRPAGNYRCSVTADGKPLNSTTDLVFFKIAGRNKDVPK
jgi:hypothetical protein